MFSTLRTAYKQLAINIYLGLLVNLIFRNIFSFILTIVFSLVGDTCGSGKRKKKCILVWRMVSPTLAYGCKENYKEL